MKTRQISVQLTEEDKSVMRQLKLSEQDYLAAKAKLDPNSVIRPASAVRLSESPLQLTADEQRIAKQLGLTDSQFCEHKAKVISEGGF